MKHKFNGITLPNKPITKREDTKRKLKTLDKLMRKYYKNDKELLLAFQEVIKKVLCEERREEW